MRHACPLGRQAENAFIMISWRDEAKHGVPGGQVWEQGRAGEPSLRRAVQGGYPLPYRVRGAHGVLSGILLPGRRKALGVSGGDVWSVDPMLLILSTQWPVLKVCCRQQGIPRAWRRRRAAACVEQGTSPPHPRARSPPTTSQAHAPCRHYCEPGSVSEVQEPCPAGRYGSSVGLGDSQCTGACPAGWFCPTGSSDPRANACGTPVCGIDRKSWR
jgi:hypothetical protein